MVIEEAKSEETKESLNFSTHLSNVILKNLEEVLKSRAVFIVLAYIEHPETSELILSQIKAKKKEISKIAKELPHAKGLQILLSKL